MVLGFFKALFTISLHSQSLHTACEVLSDSQAKSLSLDPSRTLTDGTGMIQLGMSSGFAQHELCTQYSSYNLHLVAQGSGARDCYTYLQVHADIDLHLLEDRSVDLHPVLLDRCISMRRHENLPELKLPATHLMGR